MYTSDTSVAAQALQMQIRKAIPGAQLLLMAFEMSELARDLTRERIRREHPGWLEADVKREILRLSFLPDPLPPQLP